MFITLAIIVVCLLFEIGAAIRDTGDLAALPAVIGQSREAQAIRKRRLTRCGVYLIVVSAAFFYAATNHLP